MKSHTAGCWHTWNPVPRPWLSPDGNCRYRHAGHGNAGDAGRFGAG